MNKISNNISFKSKIRFVDSKTFDSLTSHLNYKRHEIGFPWSPKDVKMGRKIFTTKIMDCIAGGIVQDKKVNMFHLCVINQESARKYNLKGFNIRDVERRILQGIDLARENLHGLILGGFQQQMNPRNYNALQKIKKVFEKNDIPYSIMGARRDVHHFGRYSIMYDGKNDTWFITNNLTKCDEFGGGRKEIDILETGVSYNTYMKMKDKRGGVLYLKERKETDVENFFKSQFEEVRLSKFDTFA